MIEDVAHCLLSLVSRTLFVQDLNLDGIIMYYNKVSWWKWKTSS